MPRQGVSLVINTYNQARFLAQSVGSGLAQTTPPLEILVVDDGSTQDDPAEALAAFPAARLIRRENGGLAAARNTGLHAAQGDLIVFLDADDRLTPGALAAGLARLAASPEADVVYGAYRYIDAAGEALPGKTFNSMGVDAGLDLLRHGNLIGMHAAVLYRREALLAAGGFDESLRACEDYDLYLRLSERCRFASHDEIVAEYRMHDNQMSRDHEMMRRLAFEVIDRHLARRPDEASRRAALQGKRNIAQLYGLAAFRAAGLRLLGGQGRPGDLGQLASSFADMPLLAFGVIVQKTSRSAGRAINQLFSRVR